MDLGCWLCVAERDVIFHPHSHGYLLQLSTLWGMGVGLRLGSRYKAGGVLEQKYTIWSRLYIAVYGVSWWQAGWMELVPSFVVLELIMQAFCCAPYSTAKCASG